MAGSAAATRPRILHGVGHAQYSTVVLVMHPEVTARREPRIGFSLDGHEVKKRIYTQPPASRSKLTIRMSATGIHKARLLLHLGSTGVAGCGQRMEDTPARGV